MMTPRIWPPLRRRIRSPRASTPPASTASRAIGTSLGRLVTRGPAIGANLPSVLRSTGGDGGGFLFILSAGETPPQRDTTRSASVVEMGGLRVLVRPEGKSHEPSRRRASCRGPQEPEP